MEKHDIVLRIYEISMRNKLDLETVFIHENRFEVYGNAAIGHVVRKKYNLETNADDFLILDKVEELNSVDGSLVSRMKVNDDILDSDLIMLFQNPIHIALVKSYRELRMCCLINSKVRSKMYTIHADEVLDRCFLEFCAYVNIDFKQTKFWTIEKKQILPTDTMFSCCMNYWETIYCT